MSVGSRIKSIRQSKGLNQEEFGLQVENAHKTLVSKWEKGQNLPNSQRLKRIAEIGGITLNELLYGKVGKVTTNNIKVNRLGKKYSIIIKEGNQERWLTLDKESVRELLSKLGSALDD